MTTSNTAISNTSRRMRMFLVLNLLSVGSPWLLLQKPQHHKKNVSFKKIRTVHNYKGDNFIDVEVLDHDDDSTSNNSSSSKRKYSRQNSQSNDNHSSRMKQQEVMAWDLFGSFSSDNFQPEEEIRVMQWEKRTSNG